MSIKYLNTRTLIYLKNIPGVDELTTLPTGDWARLIAAASEKPSYVHGEFTEISLPIRQNGNWLSLICLPEH